MLSVTLKCHRQASEAVLGMQHLGTKLGGFLCIPVQGCGHTRLVLAAACLLWESFVT